MSAQPSHAFFTTKNILAGPPRESETTKSGRPIKGATVNRELACLKAFFNWTILQKWLPEGSNPVRWKPYPDTSEKGDITEDELRKVLPHLSELYRPWALLTWYLELRIGDIDALRRKNVGLERREIWAFTKKGRRWMTVPIDGTVTEILEQLGPKSSGPILGGRKEGLPLREWQRACKRAVSGRGSTGTAFDAASPPTPMKRGRASPPSRGSGGGKRPRWL